jgi:hypothetical protein
VITPFVLHDLSPESVIVSGDKSTLIMRPVFGEYYTELHLRLTDEQFSVDLWLRKIVRVQGKDVK